MAQTLEVPDKRLWQTKEFLMQSSNENDQTQMMPTTPAPLTNEAMAQMQADNARMKQELASRSLPAAGNPEARVADPTVLQVQARYDIVQNQSTVRLIMPDLKTGPEDMGLSMNPGEYIKLSDFYTPQEINRSKGLRRAATEMKSFNGNFVLIPLKCEEDAKLFVVPEKTKYPKGTIVEDMADNDFDLRFEELETKEAKANEKILKKTLAGRVTKKHGTAPATV
jgi:hypothetical protein